MDPESFADGLEFTDANPSPEPLFALPEIGVDDLRVNPHNSVPGEIWAAVDLWLACTEAAPEIPEPACAFAGGAAGGRKPVQPRRLVRMPEAGGLFDQPAPLMDAFDICAAAHQKLMNPG